MTIIYILRWDTITSLTLSKLMDHVIIMYNYFLYMRSVDKSSKIHCASKTSHLWLAIILTYTIRLRKFLAEVLLRKWEIRRCFAFPPHLSSASTLLCETWNPEIANFHLNTLCCFALQCSSPEIFFRFFICKWWVSVHSGCYYLPKDVCFIRTNLHEIVHFTCFLGFCVSSCEPKAEGAQRQSIRYLDKTDIL